ncbi:MAG: hypothetical protein IJ159_00420 [Prevotella sp.]|nr:hypothetical protein [Prevotella sp.]
MKKYFLSFLMMAMGTVLITSCLGDDNDNNNNKPVDIVTTTGLYVINNGSWNQNNGSMTYFDYESLSAQQVLSGPTGLGDTPNDAYTLGDTIFVVGSSENTIFVINKKNFSIIERVNTVDELGEAEGYSPRHITGYNNKVYFTTYGGYVGELDAKTLTITNKCQVGSGPEGLAVGGSTSDPVLYVANSDYSYGNASISKIPLSSGTLGTPQTITHEKIRNPQEIVPVGDDFYFLDWGYYDENWNQMEAGLYYYSKGTVTKVVPDATGIGVGVVYVSGYAVGYNIVTFNAPYGATGKPTFNKVNTYTNPQSAMPLNLSGDSDFEIVSPAAIAVDPITGNIIIASRPIDPDTGYASSTLPGYANMYHSDLTSSEATYIQGTHFTTGIEPHKIGFTIGTKTITY